MKKKLSLFTFHLSSFTFYLLPFLLLLASCNKRCHCYGYDGAHTYFTQQEVDNEGGSCPNMIYFDNQRFYSLCEWDY